MHEFAKSAKDQVALLQDMYDNMKSIYTEVCEFFLVDTKKHSLEDLFSQMNEFRIDYQVISDRLALFMQCMMVLVKPFTYACWLLLQCFIKSTLKWFYTKNFFIDFIIGVDKLTNLMNFGVYRKGNT